MYSSLFHNGLCSKSIFSRSSWVLSPFSSRHTLMTFWESLLATMKTLMLSFHCSHIYEVTNQAYNLKQRYTTKLFYISIQGNSIMTTIYYKETKAHNYLHYKSSHPLACKKAIPPSAIANYSGSNAYTLTSTKASDEMVGFFHNHGFP